VTSPFGTVVRVAIGMVGVLIVLACVAFRPQIGPAALWGAVMGAVLVAAAVFEVGRYRTTAGVTPTEGFERTDEVFVDPTTGVRMRVWFDPRSGRRRYERDA